MTACGPFGLGPSPWFPQYLAVVIGAGPEPTTDRSREASPKSAAESLDELFEAHGLCLDDARVPARPT